MDARSFRILALPQILLSGEPPLSLLSICNAMLTPVHFISQVSNSYVMKKIVVILYPPSNKVWNRLQADEFEREGEVSTSTVDQLTTDEGVSHHILAPSGLHISKLFTYYP